MDVTLPLCTWDKVNWLLFVISNTKASCGQRYVAQGYHSIDLCCYFSVNSKVPAPLTTKLLDCRFCTKAEIWECGAFAYLCLNVPDPYLFVDHSRYPFESFHRGHLQNLREAGFLLYDKRHAELQWD